MKDVVEPHNHQPLTAAIRLGFWAPVYGNWIVSKLPETQNASFDYTRRLTLPEFTLSPSTSSGQAPSKGFLAMTVLVRF